ncbi:uncharacterized protein LOC142140150 [Mixophyes fleayi]|uniref:uncharacterized protein LOC142140150 n=1 Tax=Mixophyes fleayi TaxID=3061075 RepID=UPI003F4D8A32
MLFGQWHLSSPAAFPFTIKPDFIKILGVWFGGEEAALKCWEERLATVRQKVGLWSLRDLTIEGKALVLRNEILPVLQYTAQAWPPLAAVCKTITRTVFHFIWGSKMDRVKRSVMYKDPLIGRVPTMLWAFFVCNCICRTLLEKNICSAGKSMSRFFLLLLWRNLGWDKWDSSFPYNWTTPWFYLDVGQFVREHHLEGLKPDLWKPKTIHKIIKAKDVMESVPGLPVATAKHVWENVASKRLTNRHKDIAWMAIRGVCLSENSCTPGTCADMFTAHFVLPEGRLLSIFFGTAPLHRHCWMPWNMNLRTMCPGLAFHTIRYFMDYFLGHTPLGQSRRPGAL